MIINGRALSALLIAACALGAASCSSKDAPKLAEQCDAVFGSAVTEAEGACDGPGGAIHVYGTGNSGSELMLAEDADGGDYAWARVGDSWHRLSQEGTNGQPFRDCTGG